MAETIDQTPVVTRNDEKSRYEIHLGDTVAGFAAFRPHPGRIAFTHTVVNPEFEGRGLGSILVREALADTTARGEVIVPFCPFIQDWLKRHPEFDGAIDWEPATA